jgi:hypothetical protein
VDAAALLGIDPSKVSRITRGQFRGFSEAKLLKLVARLGHDMKLVAGSVQRRTEKLELKSTLKGYFLCSDTLDIGILCYCFTKMLLWQRTRLQSAPPWTRRLPASHAPTPQSQAASHETSSCCTPHQTHSALGRQLAGRNPYKHF